MKKILTGTGVLNATAMVGLTVLASAAIAGGLHPRPPASCCGAAGGSSVARAYSAEQVMLPYQPEYGSPYHGFLSGYEGLPSMDGGGVHQRYPYHSYRRPWFHPGPASSNVTIVW